MLLALALLLLLTGIGVVNFGALGGSLALEEGARRYETALRMARADAANKARRLRLSFDEETGRPFVLWEPKPLVEPGQFVEYTACPWADLVELPGVQVIRCDFTGASRYRTFEEATVSGSEAAAATLAPVTFEPDGSSDSVVLELEATDAPETRRARIELSGLTGTVTRRILTLEELEELGEY